MFTISSSIVNANFRKIVTCGFFSTSKSAFEVLTPVSRTAPETTEILEGTGSASSTAATESA